jgi:Ni/Co efflux regulator RcnB
MLRRLGIPTLILAAVTVFSGPTAVFAQNGYYGRDGSSYQRDRDRDHHEAREWREHESLERRADEWRESRQHEWRENEWREQGRGEQRFDSRYRPNAFYFGDRR